MKDSFLFSNASKNAQPKKREERCACPAGTQGVGDLSPTPWLVSTPLLSPRCLTTEGEGGRVTLTAGFFFHGKPFIHADENFITYIRVFRAGANFFNHRLFRIFVDSCARGPEKAQPWQALAWKGKEKKEEGFANNLNYRFCVCVCISCITLEYSTNCCVSCCVVFNTRQREWRKRSDTVKELTAFHFSPTNRNSDRYWNGKEANKALSAYYG